jgi:hypothetical protein
VPDWYQHVSTKPFGICLHSSTRCILGQVGQGHPEKYGRWLGSRFESPFMRMMGWLGDRGAYFDLDEYGFNGHTTLAVWAWRKEIRARRRKDKAIRLAQRDLRIVKVDEPQFELVA